MKFRLLPVVLVGAALLAISCSSGGDKSASSPNGQPDYEQKALVAVAYCAPVEGPTATPNELSAAVSHEADALAQLSPPADLAEAQRRYLHSLRDLADAIRGDQAIGSEGVRAAATSQSVGAQWQTAFRQHYGVSLFTTEGSSMLPAFANGDVLAFARPTAPIQRWQIVVFKFPLDQTRDFMNRVVGLPGETIAVKAGSVSVNGSALTDDKYALAPANYTYGPVTVPADNYFVLGDNRNDSYDSHAWHQQCPAQQSCDFVPANLILGVASADARGHCASTP